MLIVGNAELTVFGMETPGQNSVGEILSTNDWEQIFLSDLISSLDVNTYVGLNAAVKRLTELRNLRQVSRSFRSLLTPQSMARILLLNGLNVMLTDSNGSTALHFAALNGDVNVVKILMCAVPLENQVAFLTKANQISETAHTALDYAEMSANWDLVAILSEYYHQLGINVA